VLEQCVEREEELKRFEFIKLVSLPTTGKPCKIRYYIPDSWLSNLDVILPFLTAQRKIRFTESALVVNKTIAETLQPYTNVKFFPSEAVVLVLEPIANDRDAVFLQRSDITSCLLKDVYSSQNVCLLLQVVQIYPEIGGSLEMSIKDSSGAQSSLVLWSKQIPLARLFKKVCQQILATPLTIFAFSYDKIREISF
jgi:hypothetical protein